MKALQNRKESGFTIIEVVLVLAIAGLIFLVVFLALPQLQESRRDTQRRSDVGRALASLETYAGSNNGNYPSSQTDFEDDFVADYLPTDFTDPGTGGDYAFTYEGTASDSNEPADEGQMVYYAGARCEGDGATNAEASGRDVAIMVYVESGKFCQDNQ